MSKRDEYEMQHLGGFTRIYPDERYDKYIVTAINVWNEFTGLSKAKGVARKVEDAKVKKMPVVHKMKTSYAGPIRRKPLYYVKSQKVSPTKMLKDVFPSDELLKVTLSDPCIRQVVIDKLAGVYLDNRIGGNQVGEVADIVISKLRETHNDPLFLLQQYFKSMEKKEVKVEKMPLKIRQAGSFLVPRTFELNSFQPMIEQRSLPSNDIHKPWKWKKL
jgi:hypothetical protein